MIILIFFKKFYRKRSVVINFGCKTLNFGCSIHRTEENFNLLSDYFEETCLYKSWLAKSPDLNLIENVWAIMQVKLDVMNLQGGEPADAGELERAQQTWASITSETIKKLYDSFRRRLELVIANNGAPTKILL